MAGDVRGACPEIEGCAPVGRQQSTEPFREGQVDATKVAFPIRLSFVLIAHDLGFWNSRQRRRPPCQSP